MSGEYGSRFVIWGLKAGVKIVRLLCYVICYVINELHLMNNWQAIRGTRIFVIEKSSFDLGCKNIKLDSSAVLIQKNFMENKL